MFETVFGLIVISIVFSMRILHINLNKDKTKLENSSNIAKYYADIPHGYLTIFHVIILLIAIVIALFN